MALPSWKDRKSYRPGAQSVYRAENADAGMAALETFEQGLGPEIPGYLTIWRRHWEQVIPFFAFSEPIRRIIYTTNALRR